MMDIRNEAIKHGVEPETEVYFVHSFAAVPT